MRKKNYQGERRKTKKEQGAKTNEKGAVKIGKKERAQKNGREQGEWGKMSKGAGSIDPPNRASQMLDFTKRWLNNYSQKPKYPDSIS